MWTRFCHQGSSTVRLRHEIQTIWPRYWRFRHKKTRSPHCDFESSESLMACFHKPRRALLTAAATSADRSTAGRATAAGLVAANFPATDFFAASFFAANLLHFAAGGGWFAAGWSGFTAGGWCGSAAGSGWCRSTRAAGGGRRSATTAGGYHLNTTAIAGGRRGEAAARATTTTGTGFAEQTGFRTCGSHNSCQAKDQQHGKDVFHSCSPC